MRKKNLCLGILVIVLVFGMTVVGCKDDVQDVQIVAFEYAESTKNIHVQIGDDNVSIFFDTVESAVSYDVYGQQAGVINGISDIKYLSTVQANGNRTGSGSVSIPKSQLLDPAVPPPPGGYLAVWRFGVTVTDIDKNHVPSKIVWSDYINIPLP